MDPITITTAVWGLSSTTAKLIYGLSRYIDGVRGAFDEVQKLPNEVSSLHAILGQLKGKLGEEREVDIVPEWRELFPPMLVHCHETLLKIEKLVSSAKLKEKITGLSELVKRVRWQFKDAEVIALRKKLEGHKSNIGLMLQAFAHKASNRTTDTIELLRKSLEEMDARRAADAARQADFKESIAIAAEPDDPRADLIMRDLRGKALTPSASGPSSSQNSILFSRNELDILTRHLPTSQDYDVMANQGPIATFCPTEVTAVDDQGETYNVKDDNIKVAFVRLGTSLQIRFSFLENFTESGWKVTYGAACEHKGPRKVALVSGDVSAIVSARRSKDFTFTFANVPDASQFYRFLDSTLRVYNHSWALLSIVRFRVDPSIVASEGTACLEEAARIKMSPLPLMEAVSIPPKDSDNSCVPM